MRKGDFTTLASDYVKFRPSYNSKVTDIIVRCTELDAHSIRAVDVGAGTGIFSNCLLESGVDNVTAVEPNDAMREAGIASQNKKIDFVKGSAEATSLPSSTFNLASMASATVAKRSVVALTKLHN